MTLTLENVQPSLLELIQTANRFSAAERLFLAKTLLDGLLIDETQKLGEPKEDSIQPLPALEEVVAQIRLRHQIHAKFNAQPKRSMR